MPGGRVPLADLVVEALMVKLKAMEELGEGALSDTPPTTLDRLLVVLGSLSEQARSMLPRVRVEPDDLERVLSIAERYNVELDVAEALTLAKTRRLILEKLRVHSTHTVVETLLDTGRAGQAKTRVQV